MALKAVFFDRDGIVNYRIVGQYVSDITEFRFIDDFKSIFKKIKELGFITILITNQQGIGKGLMSDEQLNKVHNFMQEQLLLETGSQFDDIFYCSDLKDTNSYRRKPNPGMIIEAIEKWNIAPENSWMIGDRKSDVTAGKRAGVNTILIGNYDSSYTKDADKVCINLFKALEIISNI